MQYRGRQIRPIFEAMFARNDIGRIFRFLDEVASPWEQLAIIPTLPPLPFLRVLLRRLASRGADSGKGPDLRAFLENEI